MLRSRRRALRLAVLLSLATLGGAAAQGSAPPSTFVPGYLSREALAALGHAPPPPADDTADRAAYESTRALKGSPRWALATADVPLDRDAPRRVFACALGGPAPEPVVALLDRVKTDAGLATGPAKSKYARLRPFAKEAAPRTCTTMTPDQATQSYPSGHASIGWAWALVLAELVPERAEAVLARGRAFGESRAVCGVHYPSDVAAGRDIAAGVVARLHADPAFRADLERARAALATEKPAATTPACASEAASLLIALSPAKAGTPVPAPR